MAALIIGASEKAAIARIRDLAARRPTNMENLMERLKNPELKAHHMKLMSEQTIEIPIGYLCTFSVEIGHPGGAARHLSVARDVDTGLVAHPLALWMIAEEFGFHGSRIGDCDAVFLEQLKQGFAVNLVQIIQHGQGAGHG